MVSGIEAALVVCRSGSKDQMFGLQLRSRCGLQLLYRESGKMLLGMGSVWVSPQQPHITISSSANELHELMNGELLTLH